MFSKSIPDDGAVEGGSDGVTTDNGLVSEKLLSVTSGDGGSGRLRMEVAGGGESTGDSAAELTSVIREILAPSGPCKGLASSPSLLACGNGGPGELPSEDKGPSECAGWGERTKGGLNASGTGGTGGIMESRLEPGENISLPVLNVLSRPYGE